MKFLSKLRKLSIKKPQVFLYLTASGLHLFTTDCFSVGIDYRLVVWKCFSINDLDSNEHILLGQHIYIYGQGTSPNNVNEDDYIDFVSSCKFILEILIDF